MPRSLDGKTIVYVLSDRSRQSLYIRQVSTANDKEIMPPARLDILSLFRLTGPNYLRDQQISVKLLYRIPVLGGIPVKVLERVDAPVSFLSGRKQFALIRGNYRRKEAIVIANVDGSGERNLVVKNAATLLPDIFTGPSWSPGGKIIAASVLTVGGRTKVTGFLVADGSEKDLTPDSWTFASRVQWMPDIWTAGCRG